MRYRFCILAIFVVQSLYLLTLNQALANDLANKESMLDKEGGGWSGNGGGFQTQNNIWFLSKSKPIQICYKKSENYPLSDDAVEDIIDDSLKQWRQFFNKYGIGSPGLKALSPMPIPPMALSFKFVDCHEYPDLTIFFGTTNSIIDNYRKLQAADGLGLAIRRSYNHENFWNPGYIWLDSFSDSARKVKHLLLHELGHVFGMKHDSVFVMNENVAAQLSSDKFDEQYFGRIESESWPYGLLLDEEKIISSRRGMKDYLLNRHCDDSKVFPEGIPKSLLKNFGFKSEECIKVTLKRTHSSISKNIILLKLESHNLAHEFEGEFYPSKVNRYALGPGIFSFWPEIWDKSQQIYWTYVPFGTIEERPRYNGCFRTKSTCIPASVSMEKGIVLELFSAEGSWWTFRPHHFK